MRSAYTQMILSGLFHISTYANMAGHFWRLYNLICLMQFSCSSLIVSFQITCNPIISSKTLCTFNFGDELFTI